MMVLAMCPFCCVLKHKDYMYIRTQQVGETTYLVVKCIDCQEEDTDRIGKPCCPTCGLEINDARDYVICEDSKGIWYIACNSCFLRREDLRPVGMFHDLRERIYWDLV